MRVLHVIARLNVGGTARYVTRLAEELPKHKIETFIATGFVQGSEQEDPSAPPVDLDRVACDRSGRLRSWCWRKLCERHLRRHCIDLPASPGWHKRNCRICRQKRCQSRLPATNLSGQ